MRFLIDTHVAIWLYGQGHRLSRRAAETLADVDSEPCVSTVTAFEIANKHRLGKLPLTMAPDQLARRLETDGFSWLDVTLPVALAAGALRSSHKDPFDRLLMAHCLVDRMPIVTIDPAFRAMGLDVLW